MNSPRLATSRPLGERSEPFWPKKKMNRPTASDEVARGWLVSLDGFPFAFRAKKGDWRDSHLGFQVSFASPWLQWRNVLIRLRLNLLNVCVYLHHRRSKFVYFVRKLSVTMILGESWWPQGAEKKQKLVSILSQYWERRSHNQETNFTKETFQYTHFSSCNPHGVRTNSSAKSFFENIYNFKKRLRARGYPHNLIGKITSEVKFTERKSALQKNNEVRKKILPFLPRTTLLCRALKTFLWANGT